VRQQDLDAARKILGMAIGMAPKEKVRLALALPSRLARLTHAREVLTLRP